MKGQIEFWHYDWFADQRQDGEGGDCFMKKDIKVKVVLSEGYEKRFTEACIKVAKKRIEQQAKVRQAEGR